MLIHRYYDASYEPSAVELMLARCGLARPGELTEAGRAVIESGFCLPPHYWEEICARF